MTTNNKIYIAGHSGMVGSAILRILKQAGYKNIVIKSHSELDLTKQALVENFFAEERPDQVYLAAAKVGGIYANNTYPANFIYENLMIQSNVIHAAFNAGVKKLLFIGSSCIYPVSVTQPLREEALLTGVLEPTNEPYSVAKIAGIKMCESYNRQYASTNGIDYRCVMPTNLYGQGDTYDSENSHVIPGLIRRIHDAKMAKLTEVKIWGTGNPKREFLNVDDMARACHLIMNIDKAIYSQITTNMRIHINVGSGKELTIKDLVNLISKIIGFKGEFVYDLSNLDGAPQKLLDSSRMRSLGWTSEITLKEGLKRAYEDFKNKNKV